MQLIYHIVLKEVIIDHKFLRCPDPQDNNFEVLRSSTVFRKIDLECVKILNLNLHKIIQYLLPNQHKINYARRWLDNCGYVIIPWKFFTK